MNKWRQEIREMLSETESIRPAALRRSMLDRFLYATDLPGIASREAVAAFRLKAENAGWTTEENEGWIQLDRIPKTQNEEPMFSGPFGPEAHCCFILLRCHPDRKKNGDREKRILLKAGEQGTKAYEKACRNLHCEWAAALRNGESLPDLSTQYFGEEEDR